MSERAVTKAEFDAMLPTEQGFISYWQGAWNKEISEDNPYPQGTEDWHKFREGQQRAVIAAQDSEE